MAISIDWGTSIISIPQSYLTLISGTQYELDTNQFRLDLKDLEDDPEGIGYLKTHTHNTEITLGGLTYARTIEILSPYTVTFEDGQYRVILKYSNNNILDVTNVNQVSVSSTNSAGLVTSTGIESIEYNNRIYVKSSSSNTGVVYWTGTRRKPVNNISDAVSILNLRGFNLLHILEDMTFDTGDNLQQRTIIGERPDLVSVIVNTGANVLDAEFRNIRITGVFDNSVAFSNLCHLHGTIDFVQATVHNCVLESDLTMTLSGSDPTSIYDSKSLTDSGAHPIIDMGGYGRNLGMFNFTGNITIKNIDETNGGSVFVELHIGRGHVIIDTTVMNGTIEIYGDVEVTDNSGGSANIVQYSTVEILQRIVALVGKNQKITNQVYDSETPPNLTSATLNTYTDNALTTILESYNITATYEAGTNKLSNYQMVLA